MSENDKGPLYKDSMPWYGWVATYLIIIGGFVFMVIPDKSIALIAGCIAAVLIGIWIIKTFPRERKGKEPQE